MDTNSKSLAELIETSLGEKDGIGFGKKIALVAERLASNLQGGNIEGALQDARDVNEKFSDVMFKQSILAVINNNQRAYLDRVDGIQKLFEQLLVSKTHQNDERIGQDLLENAIPLRLYASRLNCGISEQEDINGMLANQDYKSDLVAAYKKLYTRMRKSPSFWPLIGDTVQNIEQVSETYFKLVLQETHKKYIKQKNKQQLEETHLNTQRVTGQIVRGKEQIGESICSSLLGVQRKLLESILDSNTFRTPFIAYYVDDFSQLNEQQRLTISADTVIKNVTHFLRDSQNQLSKYIKKLLDLTKRVSEQINPANDASDIIPKNLGPTQATLDPTKTEVSYPCDIGTYFQVSSGLGIQNDDSLKYSIDREKIRMLRAKNQSDRDLPPGAVSINHTTTPPQVKLNCTLLQDDVTALIIMVPIKITGMYDIPDIGLIPFVQESTIPFRVEFTAVEETRIRNQVEDEGTQDQLMNHMRGRGYDDAHVKRLINTKKFQDELLQAYKKDESKVTTTRTGGSFFQKLIGFGGSPGAVKSFFDRIKLKLTDVKEEFDILKNDKGVYEIKPAPPPLTQDAPIPGTGDKRIDLQLVGRVFQEASTSHVRIHTAHDNTALAHKTTVTTLDGKVLDRTCRDIQSGTPPVLLIHQDSPQLPVLIDGIKISLPVQLDLVYTDSDYGDFSAALDYSLQETIKFTQLNDAVLETQLLTPECKAVLELKLSGFGRTENQISLLLANRQFLNNLIASFKIDYERHLQTNNGESIDTLLGKFLGHTGGKVSGFMEGVKKKYETLKEQTLLTNKISGVYQIIPAAPAIEAAGLVPGGGRVPVPLDIITRVFAIAPTTQVTIDSICTDSSREHDIRVTNLQGKEITPSCRSIVRNMNSPEIVIDQNSPNLPPLLDGLLIELPIDMNLLYTDSEYGALPITVKHTLKETIKFTQLNDAVLETQLLTPECKTVLESKLSSFGRTENQISLLLVNRQFLNNLIASFKIDYERHLQTNTGESIDTLLGKFLGNTGGKVSGFMEGVKKKYETLKEQTLLTNNVSGVYQKTPAAPAIETAGLVSGGGSINLPLDINNRVFAIAPTTNVAVDSIDTDPTRIHLIEVKTLQGVKIDASCWHIVRIMNSPEIVIDQNSPNLPPLLDGLLIELPIDMNLLYTDSDYGVLPMTVKHTLKETIKFTDLDDGVVGGLLGSPACRTILEGKFLGFGWTEDQIDTMLRTPTCPLLQNLVDAFKKDYKKLLHDSPSIGDTSEDLLKKFFGQPGTALHDLAERLKTLIANFLAQTDLTKTTADLYKQKTNPINTPLTPGRNQTFSLPLNDHFFQRTTGAKVSLIGLDMRYEHALSDQVVCTDQSGKDISSTPGLYVIRRGGGGAIDIQVDHDQVPAGTTSLSFRVPVIVDGNFVDPIYGEIPFEKHDMIEQVIAFKGIPTRIFNDYFTRTVDGQESIRQVGLHPQELAEQCISQANSVFASKLPGTLTLHDAEMMERCLIHQISDFPSVGPHAVLSGDATIIELLVYELLLQTSLEVNEVKDVQAVLSALHQDPKKLFDSEEIVQRVYVLYQEFCRSIYRPVRVTLPRLPGRLPPPLISTSSRISQFFDRKVLGPIIPPNNYPAYGYLKGRGDEHGDIKEIKEQSLKGDGVTYTDVSYTVNIQNPGSIDFDITIPSQGGRPEYVFNGTPGEVADIREQIERDFSYPVSHPDRRLLYTVQLLFEKELAVRLTKQLGLLATTQSGDQLILEVEGAPGSEELVLRRRGTGPRASREMRRFRDIDTNSDREEFIEMIQMVMDNSVSQHRSLMLANSTQTTTQVDYLHSLDNFPSFGKIEGSLGIFRRGKKLEIDEDVRTFGPDELTVSYKDGEFTVRDKNNTSEKKYKNMGALLLDSSAQSYALDFMTMFHEKYIDYMAQARAVNQKYVYLVRDPLSGYMFGMQKQNGRLVYGYIAEEFRDPSLREVGGRASFITKYDNDYLCDAPITFDKNSEEVAKRAIMGRRELYYPLLENMLKQSGPTSEDAKYKRQKMEEAGATTLNTVKEVTTTLFDSFMQGFSKK